jgi:hypothetical protein
MRPDPRSTYIKSAVRPVRKLETVDDVLDEIVRLVARTMAERDFAHFLETGRSRYDGGEEESTP